jgi:hypothetical protein
MKMGGGDTNAEKGGGHRVVHGPFVVFIYQPIGVAFR